MSRYRECDDDSPEAVLAYGRWQRNARAALKGKRGRKALAEMREALLALPEKRLIAGALCTAADIDKVLPPVTDEEIARDAARSAAWRAEQGLAPPDADYVAWRAEDLRETREEERREYAGVVERQGHGVCMIGAYLWHRKVQDGADPAEAFGSLPTVIDADSGDPLHETADLGEQAGLTFTLAWELAYRNDETYELKTPEERYTAFLAWIDQELAEVAA